MGVLDTFLLLKIYMILCYFASILSNLTALFFGAVDEGILSLKAIECLSVCVCVCFFGLIDFEIGRQVLLGPLNTKQNFFSPQTLPLPYPSPKGKFSRNLNYSSTLWWWILLKISDNLSYTHTQLLKKYLSRTSHLNWVITQPLLR